jgi:hypothetical protein
MKKNFKSLLTIALVVGLGYAANAQKTALATSSAEILSNLTIEHVENTSIDFGNISASTPAAVRLDPNRSTDNRNTGTLTDVAEFEIFGAAGVAITVDYDAVVDLILDGVLPAEASLEQIIVMTPLVVGSADPDNQVNALAIARNGNVTLGSSLIDGDPNDNAGKFHIWVGGMLPQLDGTNGVGRYEGTFNINIEYN